MPQKTIRQALNEALRQEMRRDPITPSSRLRGEGRGEGWRSMAGSMPKVPRTRGAMRRCVAWATRSFGPGTTMFLATSRVFSKC
jgi:hypothetical protein